MPSQVLGYIRVSTVEQAASGLGLAAQEKSIRVACDRNGWQLIDMISDGGESGGTLHRPGLTRALEQISAGQASRLVAARLDRLSRSVLHFATLLSWFDRAGATLVALDLVMDTSTPGGRLVANVFASVAEWERETIAARTRDGLAALRTRGGPVGRASVADQPRLARQIQDSRSTGRTWQAIADDLNAAAVPTVRGGTCWRPSSVQAAGGYRRPKSTATQASLPDIPARRRRAR